MSLVPSATVSAHMRGEYAQHRKSLDAAEDSIHSYLSKNTQKERAALDKAQADLHQRQHQLLSESKMQQQQQAHLQAQQQLAALDTKLHDLQRKALHKIRNMEVSDQDKMAMWAQVQDAIETIVHSDDELQALKAFKKQFRSMLAQRALE